MQILDGSVCYYVNPTSIVQNQFYNFYSFLNYKEHILFYMDAPLYFLSFAILQAT